jgi:periplasmic divalent cation tolerance protein
MKIECVLVWTTVSADADWRRLASVLVAERLAACVTASAEMESTYRWEGKVETSRERQLVIKTTAERVPALEARVRALHDYAVPEFIVVPVIGGSEAYLNWVRASAGE